MSMFTKSTVNVHPTNACTYMHAYIYLKTSQPTSQTASQIDRNIEYIYINIYTYAHIHTCLYKDDLIESCKMRSVRTRVVGWIKKQRYDGVAFRQADERD